VDKQKMLGQTQDDAVGEAYDKVSKLLGLGYPGGPAIEKAAKLATDRKSIRFPISFMGKDSLDFSFSGVKTAVLYYINGAKARGSGKLDRTVISNVAYAFQESVLDAVVEKTVAACRASGLERVVVGGGVTANSRLREKFAQASSVYGLDVYFPEFRYCLDNAAMVGSLGEQLYRRGHRSDLRLNAEPNLGV
jgi:N6-L-threonylcarbamoyladenine synthase